MTGIVKGLEACAELGKKLIEIMEMNNTIPTPMNTNYEKIKADLLAFGKKKGACVGQYQRLYKAESIEEVIAVVKDNFWWCAKYRDFADVIMANREQFAEHRIWVNQDVEIREGVGYLLTTEGEFNVKSCGTSTANVKSWDTSTANVKSWDTSTANVKSCGTSTANVESWDTSTMIIRTSTIECKVNDQSIARYVYENRIVVADDSIKMEKAK